MHIFRRKKNRIKKNYLLLLQAKDYIYFYA